MVVHSLIWAPGVPEWAERVDVVQVPADREGLSTRIGRGDVLVVNGAQGLTHRFDDLRTARRLQREHRDLQVVVADATWHARSLARDSRAAFLRGVLTVVEKRMLLSLDRARTSYCFLTDEERLSFVEQTGIPGERVHSTPFYPTVTYSPSLAELVELAGRPEPFVFSGGNAMRDYALLRDALGGAPYRVRVATKHVSRCPPSNIDEGPVPHDEFFRLMATSHVVVMPLETRTQRSAGQQSYLNAMRLGKPTVVNDAIGVRSLVDGGAFVVPERDPAALRRCVDWVLDVANASAVRSVVDRGQRLTTDHLTERRYLLQLARIAEDVHG